MGEQTKVKSKLLQGTSTSTASLTLPKNDRRNILIPEHTQFRFQQSIPCQNYIRATDMVVG
ncbi:hypothetical protein C1H46_029713 [Malus baccata]|uniref:Uncharacterized protein n=1 Tax=Malus baccata TaxID=106549 RepID=A0A540LE22_MALBA|nr:hypothetical protein C1H46_029713 [Malus baccata]